jgi:hypothetical protein
MPHRAAGEKNEWRGMPHRIRAHFDAVRDIADLPWAGRDRLVVTQSRSRTAWDGEQNPNGREVSCRVVLMRLVASTSAATKRIVYKRGLVAYATQAQSANGQMLELVGAEVI